MLRVPDLILIDGRDEDALCGFITRGADVAQASASGHGCLAWLDARPPRFVLYVTLGSVAGVDRGVFKEMALGWRAAASRSCRPSTSILEGKHVIS